MGGWRGTRTRAPVDRTEVRESGCPRRMRTSGRGRSAHAGRGGAELAWGTYSGRCRVGKGRAGLFLLARNTRPMGELDTRGLLQTHTQAVRAFHLARQNKCFPPDSGLVIRSFISFMRSSMIPPIKKKKYKNYIQNVEIRRLNFPDSGPSSAREKERRM